MAHYQDSECKFHQNLEIYSLTGPQTFKLVVILRLAFSLMGIYIQKNWNKDSDTCTPMFIAALFTIAKRWKQHKCLSTDEWINEMQFIHVIEYYTSKLVRDKILNVLTTKKKWQLCEVMEMLANILVVIILQHINVWNQQIVCLKLTQCYMSIISQFF